MGPSQSADYTSTLHFVQNLDDNNFGQVQIYRNDEGKFIMKCAKSFLTGDKRHSDFKHVLQFMQKTSNKNILPLFHLEQYHESNVCIEYEKVFVYTEYLNFTLRGLIVNKKIIDEQEVWYLVKSMVELMIELEQNDMRIFFSLDNIFLTLKGIPSVFLYHFMCNQKLISLNGLPNDHGNFGYVNDHIHSKTNQMEENPDKNQLKGNQKQIKFKPESMSYSLGKTVMQLFNMELLQVKQHQTEQESVKQQLFMIKKKNTLLAKVIQLLLTSQTPSKILNQIQLMHNNKQISISTEIRFNKFRYVVAEQDKTQSKSKDLNLKDLTMNDKQLNDFKSKPLSAANTPIYRLRESQPKQMGSRELSVRNKLMKPEQNFFKNKKNKPQQTDQLKSNKCEQIEQQNKSQKQQNLEVKELKQNQHNLIEDTKEQPQRRKANSISGGQTSHVRNLGIGRNSKLSLISKRNLSTSKTQIVKEISQNKQNNGQEQKLDGLNCNLSNQRDKLNLSPQQNSKPHQKLKQSGQITNKATVRASNRIKQIFNEELSKSRQLYKNYSNKLNNNNNKSTLICKNSQNTSCIQSKSSVPNNKTYSNKSFFNKSEKDHSQAFKQLQTTKLQKPKTQILSLNTKTEHYHEEQEKSIMYKPFITQHNFNEDTIQLKQQSIKALFGLSQSKYNHSQINTISENKLNLSKQNPNNNQSMAFSICINGLDKSNFLSTLQMKKSINNMKVKNISHKKDLILSNLNKNNTLLYQTPSDFTSHQPVQNDPKTCLRNYFSHKESQTSTLKNSTNPTSRVTGLVDISINAIKEQENRSGFEKKKVKLRTDKNNEQSQLIHQLSKKELDDLAKIKQNAKMNKQNNPLNGQDKIANSKLRKLSLRSKPQNQ